MDSPKIIYKILRILTKEKMLKYLNQEEGYFANPTVKGIYLHEIGHDRYEKFLEKFANKNGVSIDRSKNIIKNKLVEYLSAFRKINADFIGKEISGYADNFVH